MNNIKNTNLKYGNDNKPFECSGCGGTCSGNRLVVDEKNFICDECLVLAGIEILKQL